MSDEYEFAIVAGGPAPAADDRSIIPGRPEVSETDPEIDRSVLASTDLAREEEETAVPADVSAEPTKAKKLTKKRFEKELEAFRDEWKAIEKIVETKGLQVVVLVDGRDAGRDRGIVSRIIEFADPRVCRVARVEAPGARERTQWFFQPYVAHLPAAGEIALFDGSWYTRAAVGRATATYSEGEYADVLRACADFECVLTRSGIHVLKYWLSVDGEKRELEEQLTAIAKRWKVGMKEFGSDVDFETIRTQIFALADIEEVPWQTVTASDKREVRLRFLGSLASAFAGDTSQNSESAPATGDEPLVPAGEAPELAEV